jgi:hypothetical protein
MICDSGLVLPCVHGTGWDADDRQGNWAGHGDRADFFHLINPSIGMRMKERGIG